jgi:hypothetical protein
MPGVYPTPPKPTGAVLGALMHLISVTKDLTIYQVLITLKQGGGRWGGEGI